MLGNHRAWSASARAIAGKEGVYRHQYEDARQSPLPPESMLAAL